jgi:hypothetical protein
VAYRTGQYLQKLGIQGHAGFLAQR